MFIAEILIIRCTLRLSIILLKCEYINDVFKKKKNEPVFRNKSHTERPEKSHACSPWSSKPITILSYLEAYAKMSKCK